MMMISYNILKNLINMKMIQILGKIKIILRRISLNSQEGDKIKFVDKLKNIFFEEEETDEVEDTRPLPKVNEKEPKKEKEVIAKKVEIPKRRKEKEKDDSDEIVEEIRFDN